MDIFEDERFSSIVKDPRFKKIPKKHTKTKIDKRFHGLFSGKAFELKHTLDKRGSPLDHKVSEDYLKFYQLDKEDARPDIGSSDDDECKTNSDEKSDDTEDMTTGVTIKEPKSFDKTGDTTTDTETSDEEQEEEIDHHWQELDADAPRTTDITRRLAVCNMDWDRLRAEDFFVVFNSFKPSDGVIFSVKIYPSEYGLKCMEKEEVHGPTELIIDSNEDDTTSKMNGLRFHQEKLRQYHINRLKYFYAVVDCDSPRTADTLYDHLNGMEFQNSGCILDLRFIPDDMTFEQEPVSIANSFSCPSDYKPICFGTSALNQVKFNLAWDDTDPRRQEIIEKSYTDPESMEKDCKEYFALSSESEDESNLDETEELESTISSKKLNSKEAIAKYRALVQSLEEKEEEKHEEEFDMEITWETGLTEKTEKRMKEKSLKENLTPFEEVLQKKKELKKLKKEKRLNSQKEVDNSSAEEFELEESDGQQEKKVATSKVGCTKNELSSSEDPEVGKKKIAELALLVAESSTENSSDSDEIHYTSKKKKQKIKKKSKKEEEDASVEHIDDPRFAALYTNPLFHVDPSYQNLKEGKKLQFLKELMPREKYTDYNPDVARHEIPEKETDFTDGFKEEVQKSIEVTSLKKKIGEFCKEFEKKKEFRSLEEKGNGLMQKNKRSTFMAENSLDTPLDFNCSKKRKKQKKVKKQGFPKVDLGDQMSSNNIAPQNGFTTSATCLEENDDSDILIFSGGSIKKNTSIASSENPHHVNSVRKKSKK